MDYEDVLDSIWDGDPPTLEVVKQVFEQVTPIFQSEPNVLRLNSEITVVGDTHGQLHDVFRLFEITGQVPSTRYLFLGDYVDRGYFSIELLIYLCILKIQNPNDIFLIRGNHETSEVNAEYGFYDEIMSKYNNPEIYNLSNTLFEFLPLVATIDNRIFAVHGGLSPKMTTLDQISSVNRVCQPPLDNFVSHLLWSDPSDEDKWVISERRSGYLFGETQTDEFLWQNKLKMIVRSHEMVDGYVFTHGNKLVTIWGAPNYCYVCGNDASAMRVKEGKEEFVVYEAMPENRRRKPPVLFI